MRIELTPTAELVLSGIVLDRQGTPLPGASISAGRDVVTSDLEGEFELPWSLQSADRYMSNAEGVLEPRGDTSILSAAKPGHRPLRVSLEEIDVDTRIVLQLLGEPLELHGRVVDDQGEPRDQVVVWLADLTYFGSERVHYNDVSVDRDIELEQLARGGKERGTTTDAEGYFQRPGLLDRSYQAWVHSPRTGELAGPFSVVPGTEPVTLVLPRDPSLRRVAGRLRGADGTPMAGVLLRAKRSKIAVNPPLSGEGGDWLRSDEEGIFAFEQLHTKDTSLELQHPTFLVHSIALADYPDLEEMDVVLPMLCDVIAKVTDVEQGDRVVFLDADERPVEALVSHGAMISVAPAVALVDGASPVVQVLDRARFVVLQKEGVEVARRRIHLEPGERTEVRF